MTFDPKNYQNIKFNTGIGVDATVERHTMQSDPASGPNRILLELGQNFVNIAPHLKTYRYFGSAAVHIYANETLRQIDFIKQTNGLILCRCPQPLAAKAMEDLIGDMKQNYGQRRGKLRSGF